VHAVFREDGTHACGPRLQDLVIKLSRVSPSASTAACLHGGCMRPLHTWLEGSLNVLHACSDPSLELTCRRIYTR
jgi:hypothetical protein